MRRTYPFQMVTWSVVLSFLTFTLSSCNSSQQASSIIQRYQNEEFTKVARYDTSLMIVQEAIIRVMNFRGYTVTNLDIYGNLLICEIRTDDLLPEERAIAPGNGVLDGLAVLLGLLLVFGLVASVLSHDQSSNEDASDTEYGTLHAVASDYYRYVLTFQLVAQPDSTTEVTLSTMRQDIKKGLPAATSWLTNKYLNCGIFDEIQYEIEHRPITESKR